MARYKVVMYKKDGPDTKIVTLRDTDDEGEAKRDFAWFANPHMHRRLPFQYTVNLLDENDVPFNPADMGVEYPYEAAG